MVFIFFAIKTQNFLKDCNSIYILLRIIKNHA